MFLEQEKLVIRGTSAAGSGHPEVHSQWQKLWVVSFQII